jgi:short-subunit dehydrogenase
LVGRSIERLEAVAQEVVRLGGEALVIPADVAEQDQVESAVSAVSNRWTQLDVLINNAGYGVFGSIEECTSDDFQQQMRVNYLAAVHAIRAALPTMRRQGSGAIINVSSISGKGASPFDAAYCASKAALNAFTSALRMELAGTGISVTLVCPGYTDTSWAKSVVQRRAYVVRTKLPPMAPERVARTIIACIEKPKREVVIPRVLQLLTMTEVLLPGLFEWWQVKTKRTQDIEER